MKLIYLHGPPAAGKFTIAQALEAKIGACIFHNHLTLDVAKSIFEFGSPEFWNLVDGLRFFEKIEHAVVSNGSALLPVYLLFQNYNSVDLSNLCNHSISNFIDPRIRLGSYANEV